MEFKSRITFYESVEMINMVTNTVFETDEETGETVYRPEAYDYAFRLSVAKYYGGYPVTGDINRDYPTAMDISRNPIEIDELQLAGIEAAIRERIEMRKAEIRKSSLDLLLDTISAKIAEINLDHINKKIESFRLEDLVQAYSNMKFAGHQSNDD